MRDGLERGRSCIYFGPASQTVRDPRRRLRTKLGNGISWPREFAGKVSRTAARPPARHRSSFCVLILLASLVLRLLRPAVCRLLKQHRQLFHLLQRRQFYRQHVRAHIIPARNTRPSPSKDICHPPGRPALPKHNQITLGTLLFIFFFSFSKNKTRRLLQRLHLLHSSLTFLRAPPRKTSDGKRVAALLAAGRGWVG